MERKSIDIFGLHSPSLLQYIVHAALRNSSGESSKNISECNECDICGLADFSSYINFIEIKLHFLKKSNQIK
jgi:hypothetical protein